MLGLKWILNDVKWRMTNRALVGIISLKFTFHLKIKSNEAKTWQKVTRNFMFHDACSFLLISSGLSDFNELYNFWFNKTSWYLILAIFCKTKELIIFSRIWGQSILSFKAQVGNALINKEGIYKDRKCILMTEFKIFKWEGIYKAPQQIAHVRWHDNFHY